MEYRQKSLSSCLRAIPTVATSFTRKARGNRGVRARTLLRLMAQLAVMVSCAALLCGPSPALAQLLGDAAGFGLLAGSAVTCTNSNVIGDVGVDASTGAVTTTTCTVTGTVYPPGDPAVQAAYDDFLAAHSTLNSTACTPAPAGTLAGVTLTPGVYCVDAVAKTGTLTLDAQGDPNAQFFFLVDGALTGTNFNVVMINGGNSCNVYWQTDGAATLDTSNVVGTILSGAAITMTGGNFQGGLLATTAATVTTGGVVNACETAGPPPPPDSECGDGFLDPTEECDDGNTVNGDGCSAQCRIQEVSACSEFPCGNRAQNVQVCHIPPGNPGNAHTICISPNALDAHFRHGDYCGPCEP